MRFPFLPGDLVEFEYEAGFYLITSIEKRAFTYLWVPDLDTEIFREMYPECWIIKESVVSSGRMPIDPHDCPKVLRIKRLLDFNLYHSAVCNEAVCFPRKINGECSGCPLGWVSGTVKPLYLPGDEVYVILGKRVAEIEHVCLAFDLTDDPLGYLIFKGTPYVTGFYQDFPKYFKRWISGATLGSVWSLISDPRYFTTKVKYYFEGESSGRWEESFRLRDRGSNTYYKAEDVDTLCGICIYQGGNMCESCTVEKIKNHNICKT